MRLHRAKGGRAPAPVTHVPKCPYPEITTGNRTPAVNFPHDAEGRISTPRTKTVRGDPGICAVQSAPIAGLSSMTGYLYNADGVRVAKGAITTMSCDPATSGFQLTQSYVLGQGGEELTQFSVTSGVSTWQRTNVYGAGQQLATYDTNGLHFQLTDPLGTRRMQVSDAGQPETDIQSLPFGDQLNSYPDQYAPETADDATPLHFTGKERDAESGNDYFGARYYASSMGRWLSPDWSVKEDPVPYAQLDDPQTLNLYGYMQNNPLGGVDQDGHWPDWLDSGVQKRRNGPETTHVRCW